MWNKLVDVWKASSFLGEEEKTRRARAVNTLHLNMGADLLILGPVGVVFMFMEKIVTSIILLSGVLITVGGMILNGRGYVQAGSGAGFNFLFDLTKSVAGVKQYL